MYLDNVLLYTQQMTSNNGKDLASGRGSTIRKSILYDELFVSEFVIEKVNLIFFIT